MSYKTWLNSLILEVMNIYSWAFKCMWRFTYIYSNNSRFDEILIQLVSLPSWKHSWTAEAAFCQDSWQSIHKVKRNQQNISFSGKISAVHQDSCCIGGGAPSEAPCSAPYVLLGGSSETLTHRWGLSTKGNILNTQLHERGNLDSMFFWRISGTGPTH